MDKHNPSSGWLALVATPIGNLEDMTFRAVRTLREADLVVAEDTRRAGQLLAHFHIEAPLTSYHAHNEHRRTEALLDRVAGGEKLAVLSDAGTPSVSDPGFLLVRAAVERGLEPLVIPGPSALTYAVVACGFPVTEFTFAGFLPPKGAKRRTLLADLANHSPTFFLFESPFRIAKLLDDIVAAIGPDTPVVLIREATKLYEEQLRGSAAALRERVGDRKLKGEFTVAVSPKAADRDPGQGC